MADISHADIPDNLLHEAKGALGAASGQVLTATGAGTATFQTPAVTNFNVEDEIYVEFSSSVPSGSGAWLGDAIMGTGTSPGGSIECNGASFELVDQGTYEIVASARVEVRDGSNVQGCAFVPIINGELKYESLTQFGNSASLIVEVGSNTVCSIRWWAAKDGNITDVDNNFNGASFDLQLTDSTSETIAGNRMTIRKLGI